MSGFKKVSKDDLLCLECRLPDCNEYHRRCIRRQAKQKRIYWKQYYKKNKQSMDEYYHQYREENREQRRIYSRNWQREKRGSVRFNKQHEHERCCVCGQLFDSDNSYYAKNKHKKCYYREYKKEAEV